MKEVYPKPIQILDSLMSFFFSYRIVFFLLSVVLRKQYYIVSGSIVYYLEIYHRQKDQSHGNIYIRLDYFHLVSCVLELEFLFSKFIYTRRRLEDAVQILKAKMDNMHQLN